MKYNIKNTKHYVGELAKALQDKLWFLEHVWVERMVDIGTADATIPVHMAKTFTHPFKAWSYEPNYNLFWEAVRNINKNATRRVTVDYKYADFVKNIKGENVDLCLLSSVLHEVYDKGTYNAINDFYNLIRIANANYVAVRDMRVVGGDMATPRHIGEAIQKHAPKDKLKDFHAAGNHTSKAIDAIEFLLKYRYDVNWEHEVKEKYLSVNWEQFDNVMHLYGYAPMCTRFFTPPFILNDWEKNFGLSPESMPKTHCEMIYHKIL